MGTGASRSDRRVQAPCPGCSGGRRGLLAPHLAFFSFNAPGSFHLKLFFFFPFMKNASCREFTTPNGGFASVSFQWGESLPILSH